MIRCRSGQGQDEAVSGASATRRERMLILPGLDRFQDHDLDPAFGIVKVSLNVHKDL